MTSIQISIEAKEEEQDVLVSELTELGAEGFEQTDSHLIAYFNEPGFRSYEVNQLLQPYSFSTLAIKEQNWNAVWESNFQPVVVANYCGIRAGFHPPVLGVELEIIITPKMSFGTGHHATTRMMIEQMRRMKFQDKVVFDFGTGTGILSILAEKLGAARVIAIDVDPWSIENARENCQNNNCRNVVFQLSSEIPFESFDIILANINRNVILHYLPLLKERVKGQLLLSGLLNTDEKEVSEACRKYGLMVVKRTEKNNWISLLTQNEFRVKLT